MRKMSMNRRRKLFVLVVLGFFINPIPIAVAQSESSSPDNVDILIAVDESASLTSASVRAEKDALRTIIQSPEVSRGGVRIGILPFSSGKNSPRRINSCELRAVDTAGKEQLIACADQIMRQIRRGEADTDFAGVIDKAVSLFGKSDATKVILLLTDGKYDPDGDEIVSPQEKLKLDESLFEAKKNKISVWALGFGQADKGALDEYVRAGYEGDKDCATRPEAVIANVADLSAEMQQILDFATCTGGTAGVANPKFEFEVNPLLSRLNIEVTATANLEASSVSVKSPSGEVMCADAEVASGRWTCSTTIGGGDGGTWTVESAASGAKARVTWNGQINIQVTECLVKENARAAAEIKVSRADGEQINFDVGPNMQWPKVIVTLSNDETGELYRTNKIELNQESKAILGVEESPLGTRIEVDFDRDIPEEERLLIRADQISNCILVSSAMSTTTSSSVIDGNMEVPADPTPTSPPASFPWWLLVFGLSIFGFLLWVATARLRVKRFPEDAELLVQNPINPTVFNSVETIAGLRNVYFDVESGRIGAGVFITTKQDARYVLTLIDEESVQVKSLWKPEKVDDEVDDEGDQTSILAPKHEVLQGNPITPLVGESFNVRECDSDSAPNRSDAVFIKVDWPTDLED